VSAAPKLAELLVQSRDDLRAFVRKRAAGLLRFETAEDLVQAIHLRALERAAGFAYQGREPFFGWLYTVARQHLADRHAHWSALKRRSGKLLRLTAGVSETADPRAVAIPAAEVAGPSTFAERRELIVRVMPCPAAGTRPLPQGVPTLPASRLSQILFSSCVSAVRAGTVGETEAQ
jgi:DNA-directed RNA polymerase specialized sigma24 family protein